MAHFQDVKGYRGPAADLGKSGEGEAAGSGVNRVGVKDVKSESDSKDERKSDYRGPAGKLSQE